jgi:hypothetical protein
MPKIRYVQGILVARKVIACLEKMITPKQAQDSYLDAWSNCREQGFCLNSYFKLPESRKALIAENRNSDDILVILGPSIEFNVQTNQPTDELYFATRRCFRYDAFEQAARYIFDEVYNGWTKETAAKLKPIEDKRQKKCLTPA